MKNLIDNAKQIVCIVPKGIGAVLVQGLSQEYCIHNANFSHARGAGRSEKIQDRGVGEQREKDVFSVTVDQDIADEIFEYLFFKGEMDQPHKGIVYMQAAPRSTAMEVPEFLAS